MIFAIAVSRPVAVYCQLPKLPVAVRPATPPSPRKGALMRLARPLVTAVGTSAPSPCSSTNSSISSLSAGLVKAAHASSMSECRTLLLSCCHLLLLLALAQPLLLSSSLAAPAPAPAPAALARQATSCSTLLLTKTSQSRNRASPSTGAGAANASPTAGLEQATDASVHALCQVALLTSAPAVAVLLQ